MLQEALITKLRLILVILLATCCSTVLADTILLDTGFEPPTYSLGSLVGQDGWFNTSVGVVQQTTKFAGLQAVRHDATGLTGQNSARHLFTYSSVGNPEPVVRFSMQAMIANNATQSRWTIMSVFSPGFNQSQILVFANGTVELRAGTSSTTVLIPIAYDVWNRFELEIDLNSQLAAGSYNGLSLGQKPLLTSGVTTINQVGFGVNSLPGTDTGYFDNLRIVSVPEPSSVLLVIFGTAVSFMRRRRARSRNTHLEK